MNNIKKNARLVQWGIPHCFLNMRGECLKRYSKSILVLLCLCVRFWCVWGCVWEYVWPVRNELQVTVFSLSLYCQSSRMQVVLPCSKKTEQNWLSILWNTFMTVAHLVSLRMFLVGLGVQSYPRRALVGSQVVLLGSAGWVTPTCRRGPEKIAFATQLRAVPFNHQHSVRYNEIYQFCRFGWTILS